MQMPMLQYLLHTLHAYLTIIKYDRHVMHTNAYKNSPHLAQKHFQICVCIHYLLQEANSFPSEIQGKLSFEEQMSKNKYLRINFWAKWRLLCLLSLKYFFQHAPFLKFVIFPSFSWAYLVMMHLYQSRVSESIWWIISGNIFCIHYMPTMQS